MPMIDVPETRTRKPVAENNTKVEHVLFHKLTPEKICTKLHVICGRKRYRFSDRLPVVGADFW